ncbi:hypothetical protein ACFL2M_01680 [Patescibacteria group bacterium]
MEEENGLLAGTLTQISNLSQTARVTILVIVAELYTFVFLFLLIMGYYGHSFAAFATIPAVIAGLLYGKRGGIFGGITMIIVNAAVFVIHGGLPSLAYLVSGGNLAGSVLILVISTTSGLIVDLYQEVGQKSIQHIKAQKKLAEQNLQLKKAKQKAEDALALAEDSKTTLEERTGELEQMNRAMIGREIKMVELKEQIKACEAK